MRTSPAAGLPELDVRWAAIVDAMQAGEVEVAHALLAPLLAEEPRWAELARPAGNVGTLSSVDELLAE